jgi:hypothetical protein
MLDTGALEDRSLAMLLAHMRGSGRQARQLSSPDRDRRGQISTGKSPDFILEVDGEETAVDVTEFYDSPRGAETETKLATLRGLMGPTLKATVEAHHAGLVFFQLYVQRIAAKRQMEALARDLLDMIVPAIPRLRDEGFVSLIDPHDPGGPPASLPSLVRESIVGLELIRVNASADGVAVGWMDRTQGIWAAEPYERLAERLLSEKADQLAAYPTAAVVVASQTTYWPGLLGQALVRRRDRIPGNWRRVYFAQPFIPAFIEEWPEGVMPAASSVLPVTPASSE